MGVVYKAKDLRLDRFVALKFLLQHLDEPEHQNRFTLEAKAASALDHPNICTVYEIDQTDDGQMFIAMAHYGGETLKNKIQRGALRLDTCLNIFEQILNGLGKAHDHGMIHRDIKPANIMITPDSVVKILDFGLAKLSGQGGITGTGKALGTLYYMSPEQLHGRDIDHRSDIWSLGVMLYEMLSGKLPFVATSDPAVIQTILQAEPDSLLKDRPDLPAGIDQVIQKALSKRPESRYQSVYEMGSELQDLLKLTPAPETISGTTLVVTPAMRERRFATIVISTLSGYTDLLDELPETELGKILTKIRQIAESVATDQGGIVNQFSEEEIMTVFGISQSHEDDYLRAVRYALQLREKLAEESIEPILKKVSFQSGLHTGLVVAEQVRDPHRKFRISGSIVEVASRLASEADADEILVSPENHRLIAHYFETEEGIPVKLKGRKNRIQPFRVLRESGLQSRFEAAEKAGFTSFAGRDQELQTLKEAFQKATQEGGQLVSLSGEAGVGKSRLLHEFRKTPELIQARCIQVYSKFDASRVSYSSFIDVVREILQIRESDSGGEEIREMIDRLEEIDPRLRDFVPIYAHLLSISSDEFQMPGDLQGEELRIAIRESLSALITLISIRSPLILMLDDWHWADEASNEVLKHLMEMASSYPLLIIVSYRPETPFVMAHAIRQIALPLTQLDAEATKRMIESVLGTESFPAELVKVIHERTGGNPFFVEELCRTLQEEEKIKIVDGGAVIPESLDMIRLPDRVESVIRARLDRLTFQEQEALRLASVIGRDFSRTLLQRAFADYTHPLRALETLKGMGLIQQIQVIPEAVYRFKHLPTLQVAYESLLQHRRKVLHKIVGEAIEELHKEHLEEQYEFLVRHFSLAEDWKKAVTYGRHSARKSAELGQFRDAFQTLQQCQSWLSNVPEDDAKREMLVDVLLAQERLCETLGEREQQQKTINRLLELLEEGKDPQKLADVCKRQGDLYTLMAEFRLADGALSKALQIAEQNGDLSGQRKALRSRGFLRWHEGRIEEGVAINEEVIEMDRESDDSKDLILDLTNLAVSFRHQGRYQEALECLQEALRITDEKGYQVSSPTLHNLGNVHRELGEYEKALSWYEQALEVSIRNHQMINRQFHLNSMAHILLQQGKLEDSLKTYQQSLDLNRRLGIASGLAQTLRSVAEILIIQNRFAEALPYFLESADTFYRLGDLPASASMRSKVAEIQESRKNYEEALAAWAEVRRLEEHNGDATGEIDALEGLARVHKCTSEPEKALSNYSEALQIAREKDPGRISGLLNSLGIVLWSLGRYEEAVQCYREALEIFRKDEDLVHAGLMLNSIGVTLIRLGRRHEAIPVLQEAIEVNQKTKERLLEGHSWSASGEAYALNGDLHQAFSCYEKSLAIRREIQDRRGEAWMLYELARLYSREGDRQKASGLVLQSEHIAREKGDEKLLVVCRNLNNDLNSRQE